MLILTRRPGQAIYIGENIRITVIDFNEDYVKFGVEAPDDIPVFREELIKNGIEEDATSKKPDSNSSTRGK